MNDEINRSDIITGIAGMIDNKVKVAVQETERNTQWISRVEKKVGIYQRDELDSMKKALIDMNVDNDAKIAEILSNLDGQHTNTNVEDRLTAIEERLDNLVDALQTLSNVE